MLNLKWTLSAAILAAAFATAQSQNYRGTFQLPVEARFGKVTLQPGTYTVSTLEGSKGIRITGDKAQVSLLAANYDQMKLSGKSHMTLVDSGGTYVLQSFESGATGKAFTFHVSKAPRGASERASAKPAIEVGMQ